MRGPRRVFKSKAGTENTKKQAEDETTVEERRVRARGLERRTNRTRETDMLAGEVRETRARFHTNRREEEEEARSARGARGTSPRRSGIATWSDPSAPSIKATVSTGQSTVVIVPAATTLSAGVTPTSNRPAPT